MTALHTPIYLDNSATTKPMPQAIAAMVRAMEAGFYNPSSAYAQGVEAEKAIRQAATLVEKTLGIKGARVIFTSGGTESNALAIIGAAGMLKKPGEVLYTAVEHPSVGETVKSLGQSARVIEVDEEGIVNLDKFEAMLSEDTALVSVMQVNNETGAIQPIEEISKVLKKVCPRAVLHVDGVQGYLRVPMDMAGAGVDLYTLSGHKLHAPKGIGALVVSPRARLTPLFAGGGQQGGLRGGTENTPGIAGLMAAMEAWLEHPEWIDKMRRQKIRLLDALLARTALFVNGPPPEGALCAPHILNLSFPGMKSEVLLHAVEAEVLLSAGSACSSKKQKGSPVLKAMGLLQERVDSAVRLSLSPFVTDDEVEKAAVTIASAIDKYGMRKRG